MREKWILEVLADMCVYAHSNQMSGLATALERAADIANKEIAERKTVGERLRDQCVDNQDLSPFELR